MNESEPKILPSSLREAKRYLVIEILSDHDINYIELVNELWSTMLWFLGELDSSQADVWVIKNIYEKNRGVIKCSRNYVEKVRACLSLIHTIEEKPAAIKILGVTGTIKSAKEKYFRER